MSEDATTSANGAATGPGDLSEASRRLLEETFNEGKLELADQLIAPDAVDHDPAAPAQLRALRGPEVLKRTVSMYRAAFPDVRIVVDDMIAADDKVVLRWHSEGTHH
ncbi:MAG: ester cyclase, partial [Solirubrobacteraceae bacterium]